MTGDSNSDDVAFDDAAVDDELSDAGGDIRYEFTIPDSENGVRLDRFLSSACGEISRNRLQTLIRNGHVAGSAGTLSEPSYRVKPGECLALTIPAPEPATPEPQDIPLVIAYEDAAVIVVDKPAGMVVHPAPGNPDGTLVNALLAHCGDSLQGVGGVRRPGIVHRLDKDTSGLLIAAKTEAAHASLSEQFKDHSIERRYHAVVWGVPTPAENRIEGNIGRHPRDRKRMAVRPAPHGKQAITHYRTLGRTGRGAALVECQLQTGRTHQIRVHLSHIGNSLIGDPLYGRTTKNRQSMLKPEQLTAARLFPRQALHASILGFVHPESAETLRFESNFPNDINQLMSDLDILV